MKKINLRLYKNNKKIRQYTSDKITTKIYNLLSLNRFSKAYLRVSYERHEDTHGNMVMFYNDAWFDNPKDGIALLKDFWKEE